MDMENAYLWQAIENFENKLIDSNKIILWKSIEVCIYG
jgi:hypothetical protein